MAINGIFAHNQVPETSKVPELVSHESRSVRIATCIAMRKIIESRSEGIYKQKQIGNKLVASLLADEDQQIVLEAARTIHDLNVESVMGDLASLISTIEKFADSDPIVRRVVSANVRVGSQETAAALAKFAANENYDADRRVDAVNALGDWATPPARMMVLHAWRPLDPKKRNSLDARNAIASSFAVLTSGPEALTSAAITAAGNLNLSEIGSDLEKVVLSESTGETTRVAALNSLAKLNYKSMDKILDELELGFGKLPPPLASNVVDMIATKDEERGLKLIKSVMKTGQQSTKQSSIETLGKMKSQSSVDMLSMFLGKMSQGDFAPALRLDVALAAENRNDESLNEKLNAYTSKMTNPDDPASAFSDTLVGGDNDRGAKVFYGKTEVSCVRCHKVDGTGGQVGPELSGIGIDKKRQYLLEAIVHPNKVIAEGFTQVKVQTDDGQLHVGIIKKETDEFLVLLDADAKEIVIEQDSIEGRKAGQSSMPDDLVKQLTKKELLLRLLHLLVL